MRRSQTGSLSKSSSQAGSLAPPEQPGKFIPTAPRTLEETGLNMGFLSDLTLKVMYFEGYISGIELSERLKLPFAQIIERVVEFLRREQLVEVKGAGGLSQAGYQYAITAKGSEKAHQALERSQYAAAAPVTLSEYTFSVRKQPLGNLVVHPRTLRQALAHLVISEETFYQIGPAVNSARSIFLFGHPGNGKTAIAESIGRMVLGESMYIPYAVEVDGQIIKVFDDVNHQIIESEPAKGQDARWVSIRRPVIIVGGELTLESLDLVYDPTNKFYEAPFQMKANGGMFLVDDFGRQQVRPRDLLNRWIFPLEKRIDYLTLHTGRKIEVPFDELIVFSTNLAPRDLVDEAFLRRIRHKIDIKDPSFEEFRLIFQRVCEQKNVPYEDSGLRYLLRKHYVEAGNPLRACHARDIVDQIIDIARFLNVPLTLSEDLLDKAANAYFVKL